jgi:hypothetical protein
MAILQALLALISKSAGKLLNATWRVLRGFPLTLGLALAFVAMSSRCR